MIEHKQLDNGFEYLDVSNNSGCARIAQQGAHLFHYRRTGEKPLLWLSKMSYFETGKAIRGGVPVCWPWFGKHRSENNLPQHGFARTSMWTVVDTNDTDPYATEIVLQLKSSAASLHLWPYRFELQLHVTVGEKLVISLITKNCDKKPFTITSALHSYFAVSDINTVSVKGLENITYFDLLTQKSIVQKGYVQIDGEVDRIYHKVHYPLTIQDQERTIAVEAEGSSSAVVWNPWQDKCSRMGDMEDGAYTTMLCVETANARNDGRTVQAGDKHTLTAILS